MRFFFKNIILSLIVLLLLQACSTKTPSVPDNSKNIQAGLKPIAFTQIKNWKNVSFEDSFIAFGKSCSQIVKRSNVVSIAQSPYFGNSDDWNEICMAYGNYTPQTGRSYFETYFTPLEIVQPSGTVGQFTGYYEPLLYGSYQKAGVYQYPLYAPPYNMKNLPERSQIVAGSMSSVLKPVIWLTSEIDSFFLHIQGSGRIQLPDGRMVKAAYAGQNGHPYFAIGKYLIETGEIPKAEMSAEAIKNWLRTHPEQAQNVMNKNPSYIFFNIVTQNMSEPAVGAAGVSLTPEYSLAVDKNIYPYGLPLWIETQMSVPTSQGTTQMAFERLMIAQDTGGAIKGMVRGDVFFGAGSHAEFLASHLKNNGKKYVLFPRKAVERAKNML